MMTNDIKFIHLRTKSSYSLSQSAIKIDSLVDLTKSSNMPAVALTDDNNMFGALEFSIKCFKEGIQPIIGTSINLESLDKSNKITNYELDQVSLIAKNEIGYKNLLNLSSKSHIESEDNLPKLKLNEIVKNKAGLIIFLGGNKNPLLSFHKNNKLKQSIDLINFLKNEFKDDLFFEIQRIENSEIDNFESEFINLAIDYDVPLIATNDVQYPTPDYYSAHDSLICIAEKKFINQDNRKKSNPNVYFKSSIEMQKLFNDLPESLNNTYNIALKCTFAPNRKAPQLPKYITKSNLTEKEELSKKSNIGLDKRLKETSKKTDLYKKRLLYELEIIKDMGFSGYFLIVSDFINWAKNMKIPVGPGRGSGAGSLVAWVLNITDLDPIKYGLIFERFLNPERKSLPDFDIDFCQERRDEVIDYVSSKYGKNSVAHIITFGTLASRAVIRDLGRVHGISYNEVDNFTKMIPYNAANPITLAQSIEIEPLLKNYMENDSRIKLVVDQGLKLEGLYRHASTHAAGLVISNQNLQNIIPLYKDPKTQKINTQFSMSYVELSGLIKFDFLGLTTLTIIEQTIKLIRKYNSSFKIEEIQLDDKKTFKMLSLGLTTGIFQLESNGMKDVLKRLKPDRFEEIIAVVALFRPGPMDNIPSFCNRKHGDEKIDYLHPLLEPALKETYGIIVYQEQVMQIAQILSGYSMGEADILRKAMGKKIAKEMKNQKNTFIEGAIKKGLDSKQSSYIFDLIDRFAGYGFNKCHAAGYALIAYQTAYLKTHFPEEFLVSSMNLSINKTENLVMFKKEVNELNINFLKPDINKSKADFSIEIDDKNNKSIRFGLAAIKGVGHNAMHNLVKERDLNGKFTDIINFLTRLKSDVINKRQLEKLIQSGSFDNIEDNRAYLFNNVQNFIKIYNINSKDSNQSTLFYENDHQNHFLKNLSKNDDWDISKKLQFELDVIGFYFSKHPISLYSKELLKLLNISDYQKIINDPYTTNASIVGSILDLKERTSKDGNKYAFITISDENNQYDLTIFGDTFKKYKELISEGNVILFNIDIVSNKERSRRFIIKNMSSLDKIIHSKSFKHIIYLNNVNEIEELKKNFITKKPNMNKIIISLSQNKYNISISLPEDITFNNEVEFNNLLKSKEIYRSLSIIN